MGQNANFPSAQTHTRINNTLLGSAEKKALIWLAGRMPAWVVPDTLTIIGLCASFLIFLSYWLTIYSRYFLWLACLGFVIQWFGDSLDGTLARFRKIERPRYGFFVDHIIDSISEALIFLGLGLSPYLRLDLALLALCAYLLLGTYVYLVTYVNGVFRISYARLGPTETRVVAIIANIVVFFIGNPTLHLGIGGALSFYDLVAIGVTVLLTSFFIYSTVTTAFTLAREDHGSNRTAARTKTRPEKINRDARRQSLREEQAARKAATKTTRPTS